MSFALRMRTRLHRESTSRRGHSRMALLYRPQVQRAAPWRHCLFAGLRDTRRQSRLEAQERQRQNTPAVVRDNGPSCFAQCPSHRLRNCRPIVLPRGDALVGSKPTFENVDPGSEGTLIIGGALSNTFCTLRITSNPSRAETGPSTPNSYPMERSAVVQDET